MLPKRIDVDEGIHWTIKPIAYGTASELCASNLPIEAKYFLCTQHPCLIGDDVILGVTEQLLYVIFDDGLEARAYTDLITEVEEVLNV
jgi:hypothetical protein